MKFIQSSISLLILCPMMAYGQGEFTLYNLNRSVPQAHQLNPAFFSDARVVVGLPGLASTHVSADLDQLSFKNVFSENLEQSLVLDFDNISDKLRARNNFAINSDLQSFFFGLNVKNNYFSLAINERFSTHLVYSKDLMDMAIYGNGAPSIYGRDIPLDNLSLNQNLYHEVALGYARNITDKLSIGARVKLLYGVLNAETDNLDGYIRTDSDSIHITNTSFSLRNSGYKLFDDGEVMSMINGTLPFKGRNTGFGFDFGAQYQVTDKINISASVTDLGYIKWQDNTQSINFNDVTYSFTGFDLMGLIDDSNDDSNFFQSELDSIESLYDYTETEGIAYTSSLVSNFYTGFDYKLAKKHHVGVNVHGRVANGNISPEFGAYYNLLIGRVVNAVINGSLRNGKVSAVGLGFSVNAGPVQLYATTESATALINPEAAHMMDARVGINLTFGRKKKSKESEIVELREEELPVEDEIVEEETPMEQEVEPTSTESTLAAAMVIPEAESMPEEVMEDEPAVMPSEMTIRRGDHPDELPLGHYVVVGAFLSRMNAQKYSNMLKENGFDNQFGFLTERFYYYVTVYNNTQDIQEARRARDEYRQKDQFEFPDAWLLSVVE